MRNLPLVIFSVVLVALGLYVAGCSEGIQPSTVDPALDPAVSLEASVASSEMTLLHHGKIPADAKALLAISWREVFNPCLDSTIAKGRAFAIAFDTAHGSWKRKKGLNMGTVTLKYASTELELRKHGHGNGNVFYVSGGKHGRSNVGFIGSETYTFDISGSDKFSALNASIDAPPALLRISDVHRDSASSGLTINWSGGADSSGVIIALAALPGKFFEHRDDDDDHDGDKDDDDGEDHDGDRHDDDDEDEDHDGTTIKSGIDGADHHHHDRAWWDVKMPPGGFPPVLDSTRAIIVKLDSNPGTYTVDSTALKNLLNRCGARKLNISVSQFIVNGVSHEGGTVYLVIRNGDGVTIRMKK